MKNSNLVVSKNTSNLIDLNHLLNSEFESAEVQFMFRNRCFSITKAVKGKCDCCDTKVITLFGNEIK
jgi:hypothetical protein